MPFKRSIMDYAGNHYEHGDDKVEKLPKLRRGKASQSQNNVKRKNTTPCGRDPGACNLSLSEQAEMVSRKHASITFDPSTQEYILQNHSTNGTFLQNDGQLQQIDCRALRPGERFCLANVANSFEFNG